MEREGEGVEIGYVRVAKKYGIDESTLRRRHQGKCTTRAEAAQMRQKLNPKQEEELCKYINTLTERVLPPTRIMVASFASQICKKEVGMN
jgi:transposase-like protein